VDLARFTASIRVPTTLSARIALTLLFTALAVAADWFAPVIFAGHSLVLGVVFYWIALRTIGPNCALFVISVTTLILSIKWGQPYSGAIIAFEGLWVGQAWRNRRNPLLADLLYWILVGTPLSWFLYHQVYPIPRPSLYHALMVQPINGLIAVWIAYMALELIHPRHAAGGPEPSQSFRDFLLKRYIAFGTFPVLVAGLLAARTFEQRALAEARDNLQSTARHLAAILSREIYLGSSAVQLIASRQSDDRWYGDKPRLNAELDSTRGTAGPFLTMLATDAAGHVLAASPAMARSSPGGLGKGVLVADREYFKFPMETGRPYVSGIFRGRGFGSDLLIAISAPVVTHAGERIGIIEGSLPVSRLAQLILADTPDGTWRSILTDQNQRVVASRGFAHTPLTRLTNTPLGRLMQNQQTTPQRFTDDLPEGRVSFLSANATIAETGWTLTVQRSWGDALQPVLIAYGLMLTVTIATALLASLFSAWSIRDFLKTWHELIAFSRTLRPGTLATSESRNLPLEFRELLQNLDHMALRLDSEQQQREKLLAELESRVKDRTRELEHAVVRAQSADRAKSAFLATVSHELRTPLTSIITGTWLLKSGATAKTEREIRTLSTLEKSSQVLMNVISDVLDYSKLEAGGVTIARNVFQPDAIIADVVSILSPGARAAGLEVRSKSQHASGTTWVGDQARLRQVLLNLAGNGVKFTTSGYVEIETWIDQTGSDRRLRLIVRDTGPGIPADRLTKIFEPFVQLDTNRVMSQAGTGLGLSISRKLVVMMGGQLTLRSTVGEGSTFEFWLPNVPAEPLAPAA
jgi:hypothetical protein